MKPVHIFIDRQELIGYTGMTLSRKKDELTGELSVSVFMDWLPTEPVMVNATRGREILVYIGGFLAFTGYIDRRRDSGVSTGSQPSGGTQSLSIGPNSYSVQFTARGKTKYLVDSSHQHPTGTMLRPTDRSAFEELIAPWGVELDWQSEAVDLDRLRLRDGARVVDELQRVAQQTSLYVYESRDGKLFATDGKSAPSGEALVLGANILEFSTDQAEDQERSSVVVKGQRTDLETWGEAAVLPTISQVVDGNVASFIPATVPHFGNATPDLLDRRAQYEVNKRAGQAKQIGLDVFHLQQTDGQPWDLGVLHYVEIPPAGVFDVMEVSELTYTVDAKGTLKTKLVLVPAPVGVAGSPAQSGFLSDVPEVSDLLALATGRKAASGVDVLAAIWGSPSLQAEGNSPIIQRPDIPGAGFLGDVALQSAMPPLTLPAGYQSGTGT